VVSDNELGERPMGGMAGRFMPGVERLQAVLTEEQRGSLREAMEGRRGKVRELEEKLRAVRKEIFEAGLAGTFDEAAVSQKASVAAKLDADITVLRAKAFSQMRPRLTAEQIEKLKNLPMMGPGEIPRDRPGKAPSGPRDENDLPVKGK
jgi:Spy/CpxP family protein refolding chaperone